MKAIRRHHMGRLKNQRFKELKEWRDDVHHKNDDVVGKYVQAPKSCSKYCCGNPRRYFNEKTRQEQRAEQAY